MVKNSTFLVLDKHILMNFPGLTRSIGMEKIFNWEVRQTKKAKMIVLSTNYWKDPNFRKWSTQNSKSLNNLALSWPWEQKKETLRTQWKRLRLTRIWCRINSLKAKLKVGQISRTIRFSIIDNRRQLNYLPTMFSLKITRMSWLSLTAKNKLPLQTKTSTTNLKLLP